MRGGGTQVLVGVVMPGGGLQRRGFRPDAEYVYPASAIKTAAAVAALRTLRKHQAQWSLPLHLSCPLVFHPQRAGRVRLLGLEGRVRRSPFLASGAAEDPVLVAVCPAPQKAF